MRCGGVLPLLIFITWASIGLYVGGGYSGLAGTLILFEKYGPVEGRGNPATDPEPDMWVNPETNKWEPRNPNNPGNRVPQAFKICQYFLVAWAIFMFINTIVFIVDSMRSRKAIQSRIYVGSRVGDSSISCTAWLTGYSVFLAIFWFIQAAFAVLPLVEYRITMQRCWDLNNPSFSVVSDQNICVDLVQYGLVMFRETNDAGFALVCGPGGNYNPQRGDLKGFCDSYYPTFADFIVCFAGASIGMIAMILFAIHHSTNFAYLKIRRYEGPIAEAYLQTPKKSIERPPSRPRKSDPPRTHPSMSGPTGYMYDTEVPARSNGTNMYNPNYDSGIAASARAAQPRQPVPEVMAFQRYHPDEEDEAIEMRTMSRYSDDEDRHPEKESHRSYEPSPPPYNHDSDEPSATRDSRKRGRRRHGRRPRHTDRKRSRSRSEKSGGRSRHERASSDGMESVGYSSSHRTGRGRHHNSEDDERSARRSTDDEHYSRSSKSRKRREQPTRADSREKLYEQDEDSPASDYYMNEDRRRGRAGY
ncbi:uncharacterized protein LOC120341702 [Styela clava]